MTKKPEGFTEKYPIHCGTAVLHMSKMILLRFVKFLDDFLIPQSYEIVYSGNEKYLLFSYLIFVKDTDSMCLCLEDEMEKLVKPDLQSEWDQAKKEWFVQDHSDAWDLRCPGKMKLEWSSAKGSIIW